MFCFVWPAAAKMLFILEYLMKDIKEPLHVRKPSGGFIVKMSLIEGHVQWNECTNMYDACTKNLWIYVCDTQCQLMFHWVHQRGINDCILKNEGVCECVCVCVCVDGGSLFSELDSSIKHLTSGLERPLVFWSLATIANHAHLRAANVIMSKK